MGNITRRGMYFKRISFAWTFRNSNSDCWIRKILVLTWCQKLFEIKFLFSCSFYVFNRMIKFECIWFTADLCVSIESTITNFFCARHFVCFLCLFIYIPFLRPVLYNNTIQYNIYTQLNGFRWPPRRRTRANRI